ncbi:uncharacterized protein EI90DRAFT_3041487 [Cantharellus anzutake]|uniref:uncharacterized protein n=1 Tax=Cantharellus anzutake TaxID=1750568 RepID=UPI001904B87B|nr:uncharacterized protein EI90DRAFT_3041487 [Cantharellus anzutake]KAF8338068.1 hypothetical protein EI90DRAFT_3041487 [Cantharellus anzutake]
MPSTSLKLLSTSEKRDHGCCLSQYFEPGLGDRFRVSEWRRSPGASGEPFVVERVQVLATSYASYLASSTSEMSRFLERLDDTPRRMRRTPPFFNATEWQVSDVSQHSADSHRRNGITGNCMIGLRQQPAVQVPAPTQGLCDVKSSRRRSRSMTDTPYSNNDHAPRLGRHDAPTQSHWNAEVPSTPNHRREVHASRSASTLNRRYPPVSGTVKTTSDLLRERSLRRRTPPPGFNAASDEFSSPKPPNSSTHNHRRRTSSLGSITSVISAISAKLSIRKGRSNGLMSAPSTPGSTNTTSIDRRSNDFCADSDPFAWRGTRPLQKPLPKLPPNLRDGLTLHSPCSRDIHGSPNHSPSCSSLEVTRPTHTTNSHSDRMTMLQRSPTRKHPHSSSRSPGTYFYSPSTDRIPSFPDTQNIEEIAAIAAASKRRLMADLGGSKEKPSKLSWTKKIWGNSRRDSNCTHLH